MSTAKFNTLQNAAGSISVPVDTVVNGSAKAWVNFNGTGTVAIRSAFNVSSITDNGVGDYTVNFTTALADANYSTVATAGRTTSFGTLFEIYGQGAAPTNTAVRLLANTGASALDTPFCSVSIFR